MTIVTFYFAFPQGDALESIGGYTETHRLPGEWTRADIRQRAIDIRAVAWEEV